MKKIWEHIWSWNTFQAVVAGIISGCVLLLFSPCISNQFEAAKRFNAEKQGINNIYLGESKEYVKSQLGQPMIEVVDDNGFQFAYYRLQNTTVSCTYDKDTVVAFMVIQRTNKKMYSFCTMEGTRYFLGDMTYAEYSSIQGSPSVAIPANNDDYLHYSETFYGGRLAVYNYVLLGNYKYFSDNALDLVWAEHDEDAAEVERLRKIVKPNVYGMIESGYEDRIEFLPMVEDLQIITEAVFNR